MKTPFIVLILLLLITGCKNESGGSNKEASDIDSAQIKSNEVQSDNNASQHGESTTATNSDTSIVEMVFSPDGFDDKKYYELLIETHLCDPSYDKKNPEGKTPCSSRLFKFYPYNHKRNIKDAFILQVKAGVNNYPYRRLLIFVRENGKLILMNGIVGYLVKRIAQPNKIDDLIVGIVDDLGNNNFSRYDVLLRYKDGKYRFIEALGDLHGDFDTPKLKKEATEAIKKRIIDKDLIF